MSSSKSDALRSGDTQDSRPTLIEYKRAKADRLRRLGYTVRGDNSDDNWLEVVVRQSEPYRAWLVATVKCYPEPSRFGINGGRISKLNIIEVRPVCEPSPETYQLPQQWTATVSQTSQRVLYEYDRQIIINHLNDHPTATEFFDHLMANLD